MGLFEPLKERCARLTRALDGRKTLPVAQAAAALHVKEGRVAGMVRKMSRRALFGADHPYVDESLRLFVLDARYAAHAELVSALRKTRLLLTDTLSALRRAAPVRGDKSRAVGSFLRNVVDASLSGKGAGKILRAQTGSLMRDLLAPAAAVVPETVAHCEHTLTALDSACGETLGVAECYPEARGARELAGQTHVLGRAVSELRRGLHSGHVQQLPSQTVSAFLHRAAAFRMEAATPGQTEDELLRDLEAQREALRQRAAQLRTAEARDALTIINALLLDLIAQLRALDPAARLTPGRSLRACYLPMLRELVEKQLQYEALAHPDETARHAMAESLRVLSHDLPEAFGKLRESLWESSAIDLEAQSEALRRKLQLDGLLDAM